MHSIIGHALLPFDIGLGPIRGIYDMTEIGMAEAVFAFLPWAQLKEAHAQVNLFRLAMPDAWDKALDVLFNLAMTFATTFGAWCLYLGFLDKLSYCETTFIAQIPVWQGYTAGLVGAVGFAIVSVFFRFACNTPLKRSRRHVSDCFGKRRDELEPPAGSDPVDGSVVRHDLLHHPWRIDLQQLPVPDPIAANDVALGRRTGLVNLVRPDNRAAEVPDFRLHYGQPVDGAFEISDHLLGHVRPRFRDVLQRLRPWVRLLVLIVVEVGRITPPVGLNLFITNSMAKDTPISETYRGALPFVVTAVIRVVISAGFPAITLWLVWFIDALG